VVLLPRSQRKADAVYFDPNSAFDLALHALLLHKLTDCGYVHIGSYQTNRLYFVRCSGALLSPF
jgi:hypothetical protein